MTTMERTATIDSTGIPATDILAGELLYNSGRRNGNASAATLTVRIVTTPASTPRESSVKNETDSTDQIRMASTITDAMMIAGMGACVLSLTSDSLLGKMRSKDQAKMVRTGIKVFGNIAGRFQKRKLMAISKAKTGLLAAILAIKL